jgi:putative ABC transport system substrate-binding protein
MQFGQLRRREFIALLGGAVAAWPVAASEQQPAMPVIGFLHPQSPDVLAQPLRGLRQGLRDTGYLEGDNVAIDYRWAENQVDRLPALAGDLVRKQVAVIVATGGFVSALAAKGATTTIPIVFSVGEDPVRVGLVASLSRPSSNLTGVNFFAAELTAKRLELLRELVPGAARCAGSFLQSQRRIRWSRWPRGFLRIGATASAGEYRCRSRASVVIRPADHYDAAV